MAEAVNINFKYADGRVKNPFTLPAEHAARFIEFDGERFERDGDSDVWVQVGGDKPKAKNKATISTKRGK